MPIPAFGRIGQKDERPMIVFVNGAQKSGSTWLLQITLELRHFAEVPEAYRPAVEHGGPYYTLDFTRLDAFLNDPQFQQSDVIVKAHARDVPLRDTLLRAPGVRVVDIERDIRDIAVSFYYHFQRLGKADGTFAEFYWKAGRKWVWQGLKHRCTWDIRAPNFLLLQYDQLRTDFAGSVKKLAAFLDVTLNDEQIAQIRTATSPAEIEKKHAFGAMNRFRKGVSGDWQQHFDPEILADVPRLTRISRSLPYRLSIRGPKVLRRILQRQRLLPAPERR